MTAWISAATALLFIGFSALAWVVGDVQSELAATRAEVRFLMEQNRAAKAAAAKPAAPAVAPAAAAEPKAKAKGR